MARTITDDNEITNSLNNVDELHVLLAIRSAEFFGVLLPDGARNMD